ncbi:MAG: endonuclease/exonuclease/phosphatase family protein, partial [Bacteroidota bacterium]
MEKKITGRSVFSRLIFLLNVVAAFFLLTSLLCCKISPEKHWWAELIAISYPYLLIINFLFIIYWIFRRIRFALLSGIVILFGYTQLSLFYQFRFKSVKESDDNSFSLVTYNVRLFDLYNWSGNKKTRSDIFGWLNSEQPDIVCFQEYFNADIGDFPNTIDLKKLLKASNAHIQYSINLRNNHHWGLATFTVFPIVGKGKVLYEEGKSNFGIYTDVVIKEDTVRIYNVHLQSNHFNEKDYRFIEAPDSGSNEEILESSRSIIRRLKSAAQKRAQQADDLKKEINASPYPVILCGDFNDPPFSYTYHVLSDGLTDAYLEKGKGISTTYTGKIPFFRIDNVLHDEKINCISYEVPDIIYS